MRIKLAIAGDTEREMIYRARHAVYATELGQYETRADETLPDAAGVESVYIVATVDGQLVGFIGATPPGSPRFSVERHVRLMREPHLFEVRALTVLSPQRGSVVATALMYAALRWVEAGGGTQVVAVGRREVADMYRKVGLADAGQSFPCGAVTYDVLRAPVADIRGKLRQFDAAIRRLEQGVDWQLDVAFHAPAECFHGGAFFEAIGDEFDDLRRRDEIINADVLDAWFPPAPRVTEALREHLDWIVRTSPPTQSRGLCRQIAATRGVDEACVLTGGGSSALIFLAFRHWLRPASRVLLLDPTYGEYAHVLEKVVRCRVERFGLRRAEGYRVEPERLARKLAEGFDLFVWVNPNNPTGQHVPRSVAEEILRGVPAQTRVWVDEAYLEYVGRNQSLETFAARRANVVVCKSFSKVYALSGLRAGYLCAPAQVLEELRGLTPSWSVSLAAQIAGVAALQSPEYYARRYRETHALREELYRGLQQIGITGIVPGAANFLMFDAPEAHAIAQACRERGLFVRNIHSMGAAGLRIAVKDPVSNARMLTILQDVLSENDVQPPPVRDYKPAEATV